jgi:hypothetical protein
MMTLLISKVDFTFCSFKSYERSKSRALDISLQRSEGIEGIHETLP